MANFVSDGSLKTKIRTEIQNSKLTDKSNIPSHNSSLSPKWRELSMFLKIPFCS